MVGNWEPWMDGIPVNASTLICIKSTRLCITSPVYVANLI